MRGILAPHNRALMTLDKAGARGATASVDVPPDALAWNVAQGFATRCSRKVGEKSSQYVITLAGIERARALRGE